MTLPLKNAGTVISGPTRGITRADWTANAAKVAETWERHFVVVSAEAKGELRAAGWDLRVSVTRRFLQRFQRFETSVRNLKLAMEVSRAFLDRYLEA